MTTALSQIRAEIKEAEERLKQLRAAEAALVALGWTEGEGTLGHQATAPIPTVTSSGGNGADTVNPDQPAIGLAEAIRGLLRERGPMDKASIDKALWDRFNLSKGSVSSALQAMKVRGAVVRNKVGKWTLKLTTAAERNKL